MLQKKNSIITTLHTCYLISGEGNFSVQTTKTDLLLWKQSHLPVRGTSEGCSKSKRLSGDLSVLSAPTFF